MSESGRGGLPERDPLADLVSRSVGARVESVEVEELPSEPPAERKRLRFVTTAGRTSVLFVRAARGQTLEAQLLPFLARKSDRVPVVHSRGIPPPSTAMGPWVLIEDVFASASGCDGDAGDIVRAKLAIERAVAADLPALRALGLGEGAEDLGSLASAPRGLVHGALACANALRVERGVVIVDWSHAFLGPTVLDAVSVAADLARRGDDAGAARARDTYVRESGDPSSEEHWETAHLRIP